MGVFHTAALVNPGAEDGDATGWITDLGGSAPEAKTGGPHSGTWRFTLGNSAWGGYYQDFVLPTAVKSAAGIGAVILNPSVFHSDFSGDTDVQRVRFHALDASDKIVQTIVDVFANSYDDSWFVRSFELRLHTEARKIRLYSEGVRITGTELSAYQDDYNLDFLVNSQYRFDIGLLNTDASDSTSLVNNPAGGADPANWTVHSGNFDASYTGKSAPGNLHNVASTFFRGVSTAAMMATQVVCLTNVFSLYDAIDTGSIDLTLSYQQGTFDANDRGRARIDFLSGSGTLLSSMQTDFVVANNHWETRAVNTVCPALTRRIAVSLMSSATGYDNNWFTTIEVYLLLNSNYIDGNNDPFPASGLVTFRDFPGQGDRDFPSPAGLIRDIPIA